MGDSTINTAHTDTAVFVLDTNRRPLAPCRPSRARKLLRGGKAAIWRMKPFTIILKRAVAEEEPTQPLRLKLDPGSRHTGLALLDGGRVVWLGQIDHRADIHKKMQQRANYRRRRRSANLRYREPRFDNRRRKQGWLPPSILSRVDNTRHWVDRLCRIANVKEISCEDIKFDMQFITNPEISGKEYQHPPGGLLLRGNPHNSPCGTLAGYEVREYLLEKWGHKCAYCGAENTPLEVEHIRPKCKGGTDRVSNLTLACHKCNQKKGSQDVKEFLTKS